MHYMEENGAVNLSICHPLTVHPCKQVEPVFDMVKVAARFPAWEIVIKAFGPVLDALHRPFNQAFLQRGMDMVIQVQEPACLRIPSATISRNRMPSMGPDQTKDKPLRNKHVFSLDTASARTCLSFGSMATQSHTISEPVLIRVSSIRYSENLLFPDAIFLLGLHL
jgi:hypothetical protein